VHLCLENVILISLDLKTLKYHTYWSRDGQGHGRCGSYQPCNR
jgi:hypothetical protein